MNNVKQTTDPLVNVSTRQALVYIFRLSSLIIRNIGATINAAVHRWPWAFIVAILLTSVLTSHICIGQARAERDQYSKSNAHMKALLDSYQAGSKEGGQR